MTCTWPEASCSSTASSRSSARWSPTSSWPGSIRGSGSKRDEMSVLAPAVPVTAEDRVSVASNWQLVWWRFRKHRLALASALVLLLLYVVVLCPDFFSTQDPEATEARLAFIPIQRLHAERAPRRHLLRRPGRAARGNLRLLRRAGRRGDPAADRALAIAADDPDLAGAHCGAAARLVAAAGVLRDHGDPVARGLDHARARSPRPLPGASRGRLRAGGRASGAESRSDHRPSHGADLSLAHHRDQHARDPRDDHQRDVAVAPGPRHSTARDQLGRAPPGGAEHPDGRPGALAPRAGRRGDPLGPGLQSGGRRVERCRRPVQPVTTRVLRV